MEQAVMSLKRAVWLFRVLLGDVVVSGQHYTTIILNHLHAGLELRLIVASFTCRFGLFPSNTGLEVVGGVA
jgi:hypothetical protein